jgi:hypothetical protein
MNGTRMNVWDIGGAILHPAQAGLPGWLARLLEEHVTGFDSTRVFARDRLCRIIAGGATKRPNPEQPTPQ